MELVALVGGLLTVVPLAVIGVAVWLVLRSRRSTVRRGPMQPYTSPAQGAGAPRGLPVPAPGSSPRGQWYAQVTPAGDLPVFQGHGTLSLYDGWLAFVPDGQTDPVWTVAATEVGASKRSLLSAGDVDLHTPQTGAMTLTVSHERINRVVGNDLKALRERGYAEEFLGMLATAGGRVG